MASKTHVQDNSIVERRLRPIYEWLDGGNNKKALQECEKVLKKTPNLHCARALKALALFRMNKEAECVHILEALNNEQLSDSAALQAVTLCYRELQQMEKVCELYEKAIKLDASNEELHTHLFMSYVRLGDYQMQQKTALNLYKLKPKTPYYCWAVMSVIQQATRGPGLHDPHKRALLLVLAKRMMDKLIGEGKLEADGKMEAEPEVQLYLMILDLQADYAGCLDVYDGALGGKLVCASATLSKIPYLVKLERWAALNVLCKSILADNMDRWNVWKDYMRSVFELMAAKEPRETNNHVTNHVDDVEEGDGDAFDLESVDDSPEKAHEFICRLVENGSDNGYHLRGPYLARFELCAKLTACSMLDSNDLLGEPIELFIEYFRKFGHKAACVPDLRIYLHLLDGERRMELSGRLLKDVGIGATSVPQSEHQMQRHICSLQLSRLCGGHRNLGTDHLAALVTALSLHYQHGYQTYGMGLLSTDQGPADAYAILAVHVLYDLARTTSSSQPLVTALVLLQSLLANSPSCFAGKLLGIRLYHTLGAPLGAQRMYESLDVKHLQLDSLGWLHCARVATTGLLTLAAQLYDTTFSFFSLNYKDTSDYLTFSYKYGSFNKLNDFIDFRETLNNSYHYLLTVVDRILLNIVQTSTMDGVYHIDYSLREGSIDWDQIRDNGDLNVCACWEPERASESLDASNEIKDLLAHNKHFLRLRTYVAEAVSATVDVVRSHRHSNTLAKLTNVIDEWETYYSSVCALCCPPIRQDIIAVPLPSRLHLYIESAYADILVPMFRLIENSTQCTKLIEQRIEKLIDFVCSLIEEHNASEDFDWTKREVMERVVNAFEILCIAISVYMLCNDLLRPYQGKKSKKKAEPIVKDVLVDLRTCLHAKTKQLDVCLEKWKARDGGDLSDRLALLNLASDGQTSVFSELRNSHIVAVKEIRAVLKNKLKLLNGVNC